MPGWNDSAETIIAGTGQVYVAPVGTALPANAESALNAAFLGLGYHTEDGVSVNQTPEIVEHGAWQTKHPIRRVREAEEFLITFALLQWNEVNVPLAFGGGDIIDLGSGQYRFDPPVESDELDERALIADVIDGDRRLRWVIPRGSVTEGVTSEFTRASMSGIPITFKALAPEDGSKAWYWLSNDAAAFAAGS